MPSRSHILSSFLAFIWIPIAVALSSAAWSGHLSDSAGKPVSAAVVRLHSASAGRDYTSTTKADGTFAFSDLPADRYELSVNVSDKQWKAESPLVVAREAMISLQLTSSGQVQVSADAVASGQAAA